jgi:transposase InsO family protein
MSNNFICDTSFSILWHRLLRRSVDRSVQYSANALRVICYEVKVRTLEGSDSLFTIHYSHLCEH